MAIEIKILKGNENNLIHSYLQSKLSDSNLKDCVSKEPYSCEQ
jgi:hypothetical protein